MCQETNVTSDYPVWGDAAVTYECRKDSPDNTNITSISGNIFLLYCEKIECCIVWGFVSTGKLIAGETPGNFKQRFVPLGPAADYNIIWLDDETTMEYDCIVKSTGEEEYCVHIMARTIYIEPTKLQTMINYAGELNAERDKLYFRPVFNLLRSLCL